MPIACSRRRESALAADGDLLSAAEREAIEQAAMAAARGAARAAIGRPSSDRSKALSDATEGFAAERMNRGIRRALAGRRVEDV